jgi:hypothetical protein
VETKDGNGSNAARMILAGLAELAGSGWRCAKRSAAYLTSRWQGSDSSAKRKIVFVSAVSALAVSALFAALGTSDRPLAATAKAQTTEIVNAPKPAARTQAYIKAGGYICDKPHQVHGQRLIRQHGVHHSFRGCEPVGAMIPVNVLGSSAEFGAVKVGNHGGVAWVDEVDIVHR